MNMTHPDIVRAEAIGGHRNNSCQEKVYHDCILCNNPTEQGQCREIDGEHVCPQCQVYTNPHDRIEELLKMVVEYAAEANHLRRMLSRRTDL